MYVTLAEAKRHLLVDGAFTDDDLYIAGLVDVAEDAVEKHLDRRLESLTDAAGGLPPAVKSAILLLTGNLYANREPVACTSVNKVPYTFEYLISLYRDYGNCCKP
ncbi:MAG: head-tail connector protein [Tannerella sp.]|jgi:uncharacterized phage protein (predicted DNA packaging)|nr:head-tail connector protein [Tannerella sp.]